MSRFTGCSPLALRDFVTSLLRLRRLPRTAENDVLAALSRVPPESQNLFIWAARDADLPSGSALERLSAVWLLAAAVNLADDLADGDCDYLPPRVGPGISFLLEALAFLPLARAGLSRRCLEACAVALARAAAGQSLEVRGDVKSWESYLLVADLVAGQQYQAYFGVLWDGTELEGRAARVGELVGRVALVLTDLDSHDGRLLSLPTSDQSRVRDACSNALEELFGDSPCASVVHFVDFARVRLPKSA